MRFLHSGWVYGTERSKPTLFLPISLLRAPLPASHATQPSFRMEQGDFFFRFRSCESVALRREKSLFAFDFAYVGACLSAIRF